MHKSVEKNVKFTVKFRQLQPQFETFLPLKKLSCQFYVAKKACLLAKERGFENSFVPFQQRSPPLRSLSRELNICISASTMTDRRATITGYHVSFIDTWTQLQYIAVPCLSGIWMPRQMIIADIQISIQRSSSRLLTKFVDMFLIQQSK